MTKLRPILSTEQALERVADHLGWDVAGRHIGRSARCLRDYGDPGHPSRISLDDAYALDLAHHRAGGEGFPLAQSYFFRLEAEAAAAGCCPDALQRVTQSAVNEVGQAVAALFAANQLGATPAVRSHARREAEQAMTALCHTLPMLDDAGSSGGRVITGGIILQ